ncbi:hypothetical protein GW756_02650 [bacterium]|nr:hypothetical protein [bacterium]NCQ55884.1 hypothetical protein [Candidatus Parcubacteria bacterium]NCS67592.1 hypothetical protein [Candidatus Peregrinibacteria bacterium]NCS96243.1 hypothetical protein [bacterium]
MRYLAFTSVGIIGLTANQTALAIPPPDILISGMQSALQVFGVAAAFLISGFFLLKDTLKLWWQLHRRLMITLGCLVLSILVVFVLWITKAIP